MAMHICATFASNVCESDQKRFAIFILNIKTYF